MRIQCDPKTVLNIRGTDKKPTYYKLLITGDDDGVTWLPTEDVADVETQKGVVRLTLLETQKPVAPPPEEVVPDNEAAAKPDANEQPPPPAVAKKQAPSKNAEGTPKKKAAPAAAEKSTAETPSGKTKKKVTESAKATKKKPAPAPAPKSPPRKKTKTTAETPSTPKAVSMDDGKLKIKVPLVGGDKIGASLSARDDGILVAFPPDSILGQRLGKHAAKAKGVQLTEVNEKRVDDINDYHRALEDIDDGESYSITLVFPAGTKIKTTGTKKQTPLPSGKSTDEGPPGDFVDERSSVDVKFSVDKDDLMSANLQQGKRGVSITFSSSSELGSKIGSGAAESGGRVIAVGGTKVKTIEDLEDAVGDKNSFDVTLAFPKGTGISDEGLIQPKKRRPRKSKET